MLSSKEANLASSRNTASSHCRAKTVDCDTQGDTHWILCRASHQQGDSELWGNSERTQG